MKPIVANNLYGHGMSQCLPTGEYDWVMGEEYDTIAQDPEKFVLEMASDGDYGMFFECDLKIPTFCHPKFNNFPPMPTKRCVGKEELSESYQIPLLEDLDAKVSKVPKLIADLHDKKKYILHYRILQMYLDIGVEIEKVHKIVKFRQSAWLKPFIEYNNTKRTAATSTFEKNFWKLLNNAVFGKFDLLLLKHDLSYFI